jgi:trans-aconitate 2-methyltransferase
MSAWDDAQYMRFADERTQPSRDLIARIPLDRPGRIVDIGCGPGNSTDELARRFPAAKVTGIDSSPEMLKAARRDWPEREWIQADLQSYRSSEKSDIVFSNAVLQWVGNHEQVIPALLDLVAPGGVLAIQMPFNYDSPGHRTMREVAADGPWAPLIAGARELYPVAPPGFYYDLLVSRVRALTVWQTIYQHVLVDRAAIAEWFKGSALRPYLEPLPEDRRKAYLAEYIRRLEPHFPLQADGKVILPFPRLFIVAVR